MSKQLNPFSLLCDDEGDDVSALLSRAAAAKVEAPVPTDVKEEHQKPKNGKTARLPLPADTVRNERGRGDGGRNLRGSALGRTRVERLVNGGSDGYQQNHGEPEGSEWQLVGSSRHQWSNGGDSYRNANGGNGQRRWHGQRRGVFTERGSADGRGYNGGTRGYRTREEGSHSRNDGRNHDVGTEPNTHEPLDNMNHAVNGDLNTLNTQGNDPILTEIVKDLEPREGEQGDVDDHGNSENKTEEENSERESKSEAQLNEDIRKKEKEEERERRKKEAEEEAKMMTLEQYEKLLLEKRKALESLKTEERRVTLDKDFESMQLVEKKREDGLPAKLKPEKDKLKRKEILDKEEKARKAVSINEFLKPARSGVGRGRGRGGQGRGRGENGGSMGGSRRGNLENGDHDESRGGYTGKAANSELHIQDHEQFPGLGA